MKRFIQRTAESATPSQSATDDLDAVYAKIARRIIPFVVLLFLTRMPNDSISDDQEGSKAATRGRKWRFIDVLP
jgi:hypothetical protein